MRKPTIVFRILLLVVFGLSLVLPSRVDAGSPIGGQDVISATSLKEVSPAVAYNSQRQEYLAVWYNDRAGCDDIRAQRLSSRGALIGGPFYISAGCPAERRHPDVTYNNVHDQYLVVWEQEDSGGYSIQARRVSGTGQVLDTTDTQIRSAGGNTYTPKEPAVAYASTADRYLVVWSETWHPLPITYSIEGKVVTSAGTLDGSQFTVSQGSGGAYEAPDLAYNRHANRYLVVWQQYDSGDGLWDIHAQQVHGGGGTYQGDITIAYYSRSSTAPAVAALPTTPTNDKFLVVWELHLAPGNRDIRGLLVAEDGTAVKHDISVSLDNSDDASPAVAATESNLQYFVTWRHPQGILDKPIKGRPISFAGTLGPAAEFSGVDAEHSACVGGPNGDILTVWQDQPAFATDTNIYGQLWGNRVYVPLVLRSH